MVAVGGRGQGDLSHLLSDFIADQLGIGHFAEGMTQSFTDQPGHGIAAPQDAISAVFSNPAAMCFGPYCPSSEFNFSGTLFMPKIDAKITTADGVVKADSEIKSAMDLKGKRVAVGNAGSGAAASAERFFRHIGVWENFDHQFLGYSQAASAFKDGKIDELVITETRIMQADKMPQACESLSMPRTMKSWQRWAVDPTC